MVNEIETAYERARVGLHAGDSIIVLVIGAEASWIAHGTADRPEDVLTLQIGAQSVVRQQFGNAFPRELHLENAIAVVEDEVMKKWTLPAGSSHLVVFDTALFDVALASGHRANPRIELDLEAVERLFARLAAVSYGSSEAHQGIPKDAVFAAKLLILRELLHHMHFRSISIGS